MRAPSSDILVVARHYAPEPTGSAPVMRQIATGLADQGLQVHVLTVRPSYPGKEIFDGFRQGERDQQVEDGVLVWRYPARPVVGPSLFARLIPETKFLFDMIWSRVTGQIPPARHVISLCPSILTVMGARFLLHRDARHVAIVHDVPSGLGGALGSRAVKSILPILQRLESFTLNGVDHIIVLSEAMRQSLVDIDVVRPISVLPPSIDLKNIFPIPRAAGEPITLLYSGNLGRKQGLIQLIDLAAVLELKYPTTRIIIRGEGAMRDELAREISQRQLNNINIIPLAAYNQLSYAMSEGDIHLVPQIESGSDFAIPSKVYTIMAAGRPFIATAVAGSTLHNLSLASNAFICSPPNDPDALAQAVIKLIENQELRLKMADNGRAYVERELCDDMVIGKLRKILYDANT